MAYPAIPVEINSETIKQFSNDLLSRKEFFQLKWDPNRNFRDPNEYDILRGKFFRLLSYQLFCASLENPNTEYNRLFVNYQTGTGKCFARGTGVLMYSGETRRIEDIDVGELVMGDDGNSRVVLRTASGRDIMYEIKPECGGETFICNSAHILVLSDGHKLYKLKMSEFAEKLATKNPQYSSLGLVKSGPIMQSLFCSKLHNNIDHIDPYIIGALSACQSAEVIFLQNSDKPEIIFRKNHHIWKEYYSHFAGLLSKCGFCISDNASRDYIIEEKHGNYHTGRINLLANCLVIRENYEYFCKSDGKTRMKFLSGIFDYSAMLPGDDSKTIKMGVNTQFIPEILFCMRSLGFVCEYEQYKNKIVLYNVTLDIHGITGQIKNMMKNRENKCILGLSGDFPDGSAGSYSIIPFTIRELPSDDYFGITVDDNARFLLHDFTVAHNSGVAIAISQVFIEIYRKIYRRIVSLEGLSRKNFAEIDRVTPNVFVIGFTKANMIRELLKYPEFGFVNIQERAELDRLQKNILSGDPVDVKRYKDFYNMLKRRITNKSKDGFYKFYGYQEFVNRLFISDNINLTELENIAMQRMNAIIAEKQPENGNPAEIPENISTLEDVIKEYIEQGKIKINKQLLDQFDNSLLICDEVQNTYNSLMKNNYGVAIQYVLDYNPNVRAVFLSATPINNSPTEIVDMMNYLLPPNRKITKQKFFSNTREIRPGMLEELGKLSYGRVSFLQDINPAYYPERIFNGVTRKLRKSVDNFTHIPYLLFKLCPLSEIHLKTYRKFLNDNNIDINSRPVVSADGYTLFDMVFPDPRDPSIGLYKSGEIRSIIPTSNKEDRDKIGIIFTKLQSGGFIFSGNWLSSSELMKYSTKYYEMLMSINDIFARTRGRLKQKNPEDHQYESEKIMIYHDRVKLSGVLLIQEILKTSGFIDEISEPIDNTICAICGYDNLNHSAKLVSDGIQVHEFCPSRIVMAHSEIDKNTMENSLAKFNSIDNSYGTNYKVLIGSKIIREGYDIKDVREYYIMSVPVNIPAFIQELGRCIRKGSHINLPPEKRKVNIRLFLGVIPDDVSDINPVFIEEYRYAEKLSDYMVIQDIEREIHKYAIDGGIHRDIIMPLNLIQEYFPGMNSSGLSRDEADNIASKTLNPERTLGSLYFYPIANLPDKLQTNEYNLNNLNLSTFSTYGYNNKEVATIMYVIKRLFMINPVWKYSDLFIAIKKPPFGLEVNPVFFDEKNFIIALDNLVLHKQSYVDKALEKELQSDSPGIDRIFIKLLFDPDERYIYINRVKHKIEHIGEFYILFPILPVNYTNNNLANSLMDYSGNVHDCYGPNPDKLCDTSKQDIVVKDIDSFLRPIRLVSDMRINIDKYVEEYKQGSNYEIQKQKFISRYSGIDDEYEFMNFLGDYPPEFHIQLLSEVIAWNISEYISEKNSKKPFSSDKELKKIYIRILDTYDNFGAIIYAGDVAKYRDVVNKITGGLFTTDSKGGTKISVDADIAVGFQIRGSVMIYNGSVEVAEKSQWIKTTKSSLNIRTDFQENQKLIGYYEKTPDGVIKFKIRKPIHEIKRSTSSKSAEKPADIRSAERGIVCNTKNKPELMKYINLLDIDIDSAVRDKVHRRDLVDSSRRLKVKGLCKLIKDKLISMEIKERQKDTKIKYFYLWYDVRPEISNIFQRTGEMEESPE